MMNGESSSLSHAHGVNTYALGNSISGAADGAGHVSAMPVAAVRVETDAGLTPHVHGTKLVAYGKYRALSTPM
jgi:hypothetical protein